MVAVGDQATASWANRRPESASGATSITPTAANTATSVPVTFPFPFTTQPVVVATVNSSSSVAMQVGVTGVSTTGCTVWLTAANTTTRGIYWIATGS